MRTFLQKSKPTQPITSTASSTVSRTRVGQRHGQNSILFLQRTIGNQSPPRFLQNNTEPQKPAITGTAPPRSRHNFSRTPARSSNADTLQTKLVINRPADKDEQEADRVADLVMRMPELRMQRTCPCGGECPKYKTEQLTLEREHLQTKIFQATDVKQVTAPPIVYEVLRYPGQPLDEATRSYFEPRFRHDFRDVRIYTNAKAAQSAERLNAKAFTIGNRIVFNASQFAPNTSEGRQLLAHELTHVVQTRTGNILRWRIDKCTIPFGQYITDAVARAYEDITAVLRFMRVSPLPQRVRDALWLAFRDNSMTTANQVRRNLQSVRYGVNHAHYHCHNRGDADYSKNCSTETYGHVGFTGAGATQQAQDPIFICMPGFANLSVHAQSRGLIHEVAHRYLGLSSDPGYFEINECAETSEQVPGNASSKSIPGTAGAPPAQRLANPDSYGCFVHYMTYLPQTRAQARAMPPRGPRGHEEPPLRSLEEQAASYRGEKLRIVGESTTLFPTEIHTRTIVERDPTFRIVDETLGWGSSGSRLPENSGFQFRWSLTVDNVAYRLASSVGTDTNLFDGRNSEVFVSKDIRKLLEGGRSRQGTLRCEIQLFRRQGRRFSPPVITREIDVTVVKDRNRFDPSLL